MFWHVIVRARHAEERIQAIYEDADVTAAHSRSAAVPASVALASRPLGSHLGACGDQDFADLALDRMEPDGDVRLRPASSVKVANLTLFLVRPFSYPILATNRANFSAGSQDGIPNRLRGASVPTAKRLHAFAVFVFPHDDGRLCVAEPAKPFSRVLAAVRRRRNTVPMQDTQHTGASDLEPFRYLDAALFLSIEAKDE